MARNIFKNGHTFGDGVKSIQTVNSGSTPITISSVDTNKTIVYTQRYASMNSLPVYLSNSTTLTGLDSDNTVGLGTTNFVIVVEYF